MTTWERAAQEAATAEAELRDVLTDAGVDLPFLGVSRSIAYAVPTARVELGGVLVAQARRLAELVRKGWESEQASTDCRTMPNPGDLVVDTSSAVVGKVIGWDPTRGTISLRPADGGASWETTVYRVADKNEVLDYLYRENNYRINAVIEGRR
ncbi:hypothetical protein ACZ90_00445 [Streptomyces albus subsp. albus]|nr:hypothetical protein ACZ90_00445 [Streptomyces albus subsp. albus]